MKKGIVLVLLAILMMSLVLTSCSSKDDNQSSNGSSGSEAGDINDTLLWGVNAEAASLDPSTSKDTVTHMMMYQIYDALLKENSADYSILEPGLATSWEFNEDNTEVTFTLREGVKFHNGDTMTAEDVEFSLTRSLESSYSSAINQAIDHFEIVDDNKVKCVLKYPYGPILDVMTNMTFAIASKRAIEEAEASGEDFARHPCGTGAYKMVEWRSGDALVLERFDDYYGGPANIRQVIFKLVPDASAGAIALEDGTLDVYYMVASSDYQHLKDIDTVDMVEGPGVGLHHITFNVTDGIFSDKRIRKAVAYALNRDDIVIGGADGRAVPAYCLAPTSIFGYMERDFWKEQNLDKAKELLAEAGYPDGFDVTFSMQSSDHYMKPAEIVQEQLRKIGINVTFDKMERGAFLDDVGDKRQFEASLRMINATIRDADAVLTRRVHSSMLGGGNNYSGYANKEVDALIEKARVETDREKRLETYSEVYDILDEDVPLIPIYTTSSYLFFKHGLKEVYTHPVERYKICDMYFE